MSEPKAGWYPSPEDPTISRYWDGSAWTEETRHQSDEKRSQEGRHSSNEIYEPKPEEAAELTKMLHLAGYDAEPDFIIWGTSNEFDKVTAVSRLIMAGDGKRLYAIAAFPSYIVHIHGRLKSRNEKKVRNSDELYATELSYGQIVTVRREPGFENLMSTLIIDAPESTNIIASAINGQGHRMAMTRRQESSQNDLIQELKERVRSAKNPQAAHPQVSVGLADELLKLNELYEAGVLSDEEFQAAKKKLL